MKVNSVYSFVLSTQRILAFNFQLQSKTERLFIVVNVKRKNNFKFVETSILAQ